ncbi:shugoshin 1 [Genypterus blacodes]|uniref:shugoshin 1 n=1 Tax=Genypterus blacodes TaxID=154954 RepID=UPI003F75F21D
MARERPQKKSFQQSLEDIKEKMKEKRNSRLAKASAPRRRAMINNKNNGAASKQHTILIGVQQNNKALAVALQAEKERGRQANAVILQLKMEQQALFLHLLLLKKRLKDWEAPAQRSSPKILDKPSNHTDLPRRILISKNTYKPITHEASPTCTDGSPEKLGWPDTQVTLPPTVGVRRRGAERKSRRSERVQERRSWSESRPVVPLEAGAHGFEALAESPIHSDFENQNQTPQEEGPESVDPLGCEEFEHSTPEPVPPKTTNQQQLACKGQTQQQPRAKREAAVRKPERGRKAERAPLKKPWENPKRARSKSRDRSATRAKAAPPPQGNKLNTSLGFNDTFDFDCEEAVHVTPFRAKGEDGQPATPACVEAPTPTRSVSKENQSSSSSSPSESEDSLYVPQRASRRQSSPNRAQVICRRRGRPPKVAQEKKTFPLQQNIPVFRDDESSPKEAECEAEADQHQEPHTEEQEGIGLLSISPSVEAEMMRIDGVLSSFGDSPAEAPPAPSQTPQRVKTCKKRKGGLGVRTAGRGLSLCDVTNLSPAAYRNFSCGGSRPSDGRCSTPVPGRKRRCTMTVNYKEPSLNAKLRRGDKFTDLQFLSSPIFKQKTGRRSVEESGGPIKGQQPYDKYNESFVGCR